jgi:L-cysteine desulfidase
LIDTARFFQENIKESIGCTEPAAVALAVAAAFNALKGRLPDDYPGQRLDLPPEEVSREIREITVITDRDVFKNALQVGIPHEFGGRGINKAAALGVFCDPGKGLELFSDLDEGKALEANELLKAGRVDVTPNYDWSGLRIEAEVATKTGTGVAHVLNEHSNIAHIGVNGQSKFENPKAEQSLDELNNLHKLSDFIEIIENELDPQAVRIIENAIITNHKASLIAERRFLDLHRHSLGLAIRSFVRGGYVCEDCVVLAKEKVSLAVEARMTGFDIRVATCAGSGNMGIVATIPLIAMVLCEFSKRYPNYDVNWESVVEVIREKAPEDWAKLVKAVGLVHLIANYTSVYSGKLSASCGCGTKAGVGVAAGIAYYLTSDKDNDRVDVLGEAINGMARSIFGMICDGGKEGCALKTAAATGVAMESALLACRRLILSYSDGIANMDAMITLKSIGMISNAMADVDRKIIELARDGIAG